MLFPDCAESSHDFLFATQLSPSNLKEWQADDSPNIPEVYFPCHKHLFINKFHKSRIIYRAKAVIFYYSPQFDFDKNNASVVLCLALWVGLEVFHYGVFEFLTAETTVKDCAVGGENNDFGNAGDGIGIAACLLRVEHLWIWNL